MQSFLGHFKPPQSSFLFFLFGPGLPFRSRKSLSLFLKSSSLDSGINPSSFPNFKLSSSRPCCDLLACPAAVCGFEFGAVRSEGWSSELRVSTNFIWKLSRSFCNSSSWKQQREGRVTARPAARLSQRVCAEAERRLHSKHGCRRWNQPWILIIYFQTTRPTSSDVKHLWGRERKPEPRRHTHIQQCSRGRE